MHTVDCNTIFSMLQGSFSFVAAQLLVQKKTSALQQSECCSAVSAVQLSENCSATSVFRLWNVAGVEFRGVGLRTCWLSGPPTRTAARKQCGQDGNTSKLWRKFSEIRTGWRGPKCAECQSGGELAKFPHRKFGLFTPNCLGRFLAERFFFLWIFILGLPDFFADFVAGFVPFVVGKSAQKHPPGKSVLAVLMVLAALESTLPSFCLSSKFQHNEAAVRFWRFRRFRRSWRFRSWRLPPLNRGVPSDGLRRYGLSILKMQG